MHQESLTNHFRNIKRKSALEAKEKISNINTQSQIKSQKDNDIQKPIKIIGENQGNLRKVTEILDEKPLKRKSTRNLKNEENFEIPQSLELNKKINLERNINKKRKRDEETETNIKAAKNKLLNLNSNSKNQKSKINEIHFEEKKLSETNLINLEEKQDKRQLRNNANLKTNNKKSYLLKNDISDKTKNIVKNVLLLKKKIINEKVLKISNNNLRNNKDDSKNNSSDKNYMSDNILETFEENVLKNKKSQNNSFLSSLALKEMLGKNDSICEESISFLNSENNITKNNLSNLSNSNKIINDNLVVNNLLNTSLKNENIFKTPINLNKREEKFDFNESNSLEIQKSNETFLDNSNFNNESNLLLSCEANGIPKVPNISEKTQMIINQLKQEKRQNNFKREETEKKIRNQSESSFSLKFKYEDLLKEERELILPAKYKRLLNSFKYLDQTLNFFKISKKYTKIPKFEDIKASIENTFKHDFECETFLKILYVTPHFFTYSWEKENATNDKSYSLMIGIPKDYEERMNKKYPSNFNFVEIQTKYDPISESLTKEILDRRQTIFKNVLIEIVNQYHKEFLQKEKMVRQFNPYQLKTWHSKFDLDKVGDIPIFEIAEKPSIRIVKIKDFLNENDFKSTLIQKAIQSSALINVPSGNSNPNSNDVILDQLRPSEEEKGKKNNILNEYITKSLHLKIKMKENAIKISNDILLYSEEKTKQRNKIKDLKDLIERIKNISLIDGKKPSMPLSNLAQKVKDGSNTISSAHSLDLIKKMVILVSKLLPEFLKITEHSTMGTLVKIDNNVKLDDLYKTIEQPEFADDFYKQLLQ